MALTREVDLRLRTATFSTGAAAVGKLSVSLKSLNMVAKQVSASFFSLKTLFVGFIGMKFVNFFKSSIEALGQQVKAETTLQTALKTTGNYSAAAQKELVDYAAALQKVTAYGDETTIQMMGMLATFKMSPAQIKQATLATLDMAAATGMDLKAAALMMGKAYSGQISALTRYGIIVDEQAYKTRGFAAVIEALNSQFGGMAKAQGDTPLGKLERMKNLWSDMKEKIAAAVMDSGAFDSLMANIEASIGNMVKWIKDNNAAIVNMFNTMAGAFVSILKALPSLMSVLAFIVEHQRLFFTIFGAIQGGKIGSMFGPIGTIIGSVGGAAAGFGLGSALQSSSQQISNNVNVNQGEVVQAISSQGRDIAKLTLAIQTQRANDIFYLTR